jgi:hypothetical protein
MYFLRALIANLTCRTNQQRLSSLGAVKEQQPEKPSAANNRWAIRRKAGTVRCRGHRPLIKAILVNYFFFCGSYPPPSTRRELFGSRFAYLSCLGTSVYYPTMSAELPPDHAACVSSCEAAYRGHGDSYE